MNRCRRLLACVLLAVCACHSAPPNGGSVRPGCYQSEPDASAGRLDLGPDGSFTLWLEFDGSDLEWRASGRYEIEVPTDNRGPQEGTAVCLRLFNIEQKGASPIASPPQLLGGLAVDNTIVLGGPCLNWVLCRVP